MKKYITGAVLSLGIVLSPLFVHAAGLTSSQVQAILSLLTSFGADSTIVSNVEKALTNSATQNNGERPFCHTFTNDLTIGRNGAEVVALNKALALSNINTATNNTTFSEDNAGDVVTFQKNYGIRQTGYVGPLTRAKLNALYGCNDKYPPIDRPMPPIDGPITPPIQTPPATTTTAGTIAFITPVAGTAITQGQPVIISWMATGEIGKYVLSYNIIDDSPTSVPRARSLMGTFTPADAQCSTLGKCSISWTPSFSFKADKIEFYISALSKNMTENIAFGNSGIFKIVPAN